MNIARLIKWGIALILISVIVVYAIFTFQTWKTNPLLLTSCVRVDPPLMAWTCRQALLHGSFSQQDIAILNRQAGIRYALYLPNVAETERMLMLFMTRGVDINAGDENANGWTALHGTVSAGEIENTKLLLKHGARPDLRDKTGMSAIDLAHYLQRRYPDDPKRATLIDLLESHRKTPAATDS